MNARNRVAISTLSLLSLGLAVFGAHFSNRSITSVKAYTNGDATTYYNGIDRYATGSALTTALNTLNEAKRQRLISYNSLSNYFTQTDPGSYGNQVTAFYSGTSARYSGNMNREHVWPFSKLYINTGDRGQNDIEKDLHMIRPAMIDDNSGRGNAFFTEPTGQGWDPGSLGNASYRGDSARIIFYCCIADLNLTLVDRDYDSKDNHTMGRLSTLLKWNLEYPVLQREKTRNEAAESIQGHRNPFIDHPEYACRIWGSYNADTQRICAGQGVSGELAIKHNSEAISSFDLEVDDIATLSATVGDSNSGTYTWTLTNSSGVQTSSNVVSLSQNGNDVTITGTQVGSIYLKVSATITLPNSSTETLWKIIKLTVHPKTTLTDLRIDSFPYKTDYFVGEALNPYGIKVVASFSDYSEIDVTNHIVYGEYDLSSAGVKDIPISYTYKDMTLTTSFSIIVRKQPSPPSEESSDGCGGNIAVTSTLLSSFALAGLLIIGVSLKRKKK